MCREITFPVRIVNDLRDIRAVIGDSPEDALFLDFVATDPKYPLVRYRISGKFIAARRDDDKIAFDGYAKMMTGTARVRHPFHRLARRREHNRRITLIFNRQDPNAPSTRGTNADLYIPGH